MWFRNRIIVNMVVGTNVPNLAKLVYKEIKLYISWLIRYSKFQFDEDRHWNKFEEQFSGTSIISMLKRWQYLVIIKFIFHKFAKKKSDGHIGLIVAGLLTNITLKRETKPSFGI